MDGDFDIVGDLNDGSFDSGNGAQTTPNAQHGDGGGASMQAPYGTQSAHGNDVVHQNKQEQGTPPVDKAAPPAKPDNADKSVRELLSGAFKAEDGTQAASQHTAATATPPALVKDANGSYRNADGTFPSAEQITAFEAAAAQPVTPPTSPVLTGMTPVEQQQFQSLPAELQQYVGRTMEDMNNRAARYGEYDRMEALIGPRRELWAQTGTTPDMAINQLFALSDYAGRAPDEFVMWFADQHKLDLDALLDAKEASAGEQANPQYQALASQVQQLQNQLQSRDQQTEQQAQQERLATVQNFSTEKDGAGQFLRPYLTEVMDGWAAHIAALRRTNPSMPHDQLLQQAYDNACWADPKVRAKMQVAVDATIKAQGQQRVQQARNAGASINGAPAGAPNSNTDNPNRSLREELQSQFAAARA